MERDRDLCIVVQADELLCGCCEYFNMGFETCDIFIEPLDEHIIEPEEEWDGNTLDYKRCQKCLDAEIEYDVIEDEEFDPDNCEEHF